MSADRKGLGAKCLARLRGGATDVRANIRDVVMPEARLDLRSMRKRTATAFDTALRDCCGVVLSRTLRIGNARSALRYELISLRTNTSYLAIVARLREKLFERI